MISESCVCILPAMLPQASHSNPHQPLLPYLWLFGVSFIYRTGKRPIFGNRWSQVFLWALLLSATVGKSLHASTSPLGFLLHKMAQEQLSPITHEVVEGARVMSALCGVFTITVKQKQVLYISCLRAPSPANNEEHRTHGEMCCFGEFHL